MKPGNRIGLIVGLIGLVLNICIAGANGICGPVVSLVAGAIAGFFSAQQEKPFTKKEGARIGATAGAITGGLITIGQILGGLGALLVFQLQNLPMPFGFYAPTMGGGLVPQLIYYGTGVGVALCFSIVGVALAAGAGAGTGYLGTPDQL